MVTHNKRFNGIGHNNSLTHLEAAIKRSKNYTVADDGQVFYVNGGSESILMGIAEESPGNKGCKSRIIKEWSGESPEFSQEMGSAYQNLRRELHHSNFSSSSSTKYW